MITKIHSKYYDLNKFSDSHPGGVIPLELAADRDATELFESHHLFADREMLMKVLSKYEIPEPEQKIADSNVYDWNETLHSEFTKELKIIMNETFDRKGIKARVSDWMIMSGLFGVYLVNLYYYYRGDYTALLVYPLSLWVFTVNIYHDATHFALSRNPLINRLGTCTALIFSLTYCWYHQHVIAHHSFVNIMSKDPDLYHTPLYMRHTPNIRKNKYHKHQHILMWFLWLLAVPVGLISTGFVKSLKGKPFNRVVQLSKKLDYKTMYYELAFVVMYMIVIPYILTGSWLFVLYPYMAYSFLFMVCTQINHLNEDTFGFDKNYYKHQIINSHNVAPKSFFVTLFTGGLNLQIEHHLMPSVYHFRLMKIQPKIEALCKKYGVNYSTSNSFLEAIYKHYRHVFRYSKDMPVM